MSSSEVNICGLLVHARPGEAAEVRVRLERFSGVAVHASTPDDRLVVTVEDTSAQCCIDTMSRLHDIDGVMSAALVYQHTLHDLDPKESAS